MERREALWEKRYKEIERQLLDLMAMAFEDNNNNKPLGKRVLIEE